MPVSPPVASVSPAQWLERGHRYAAESDPRSWEQALYCYDQARAALTGSTTDPGNLELLGLAWMNRGNLLQSSNRPADLDAALNAYDASLAAFSSIMDQPGIANRAATARLNRGQALRRRGRTADALTDCRRAWHELDALARAGDPHAPRNAAGAAVNLVSLLATSPQSESEPTELLTTARHHLGDTPEHDPVAATLALEIARQQLLLLQPTLSPDTLGTFTDTLEAGLALAAIWIHRDHPTAADLAPALFQLGATAYGRWQPHFLLEYLRDALDPTVGPAPFQHQPALHRIAARALAQLETEAARPRFLQADDPAARAWADLTRDLAAPRPWLRDTPNAT